MHVTLQALVAPATRTPIYGPPRRIFVQCAEEISRTARRNARVASAARAAFAGAITRTSGDTSYTVRVLPQGAPPSASSVTSRGERYSRRCWYRKTDVDYTICVSLDWILSVQSRGLEKIDGLYTLSAAPLLCATSGVELYSATWLRTGRGTELVTESGVIARHPASGTTYHAGSALEAERGMKRKLTAQAIPQRVRDERRAQQVERKRAQLEKLAHQIARQDLSEIGHVTVTLSDSHRAGNCAPGTIAFRDQFLPGRDCATITEIVAAIERRAGSIMTYAAQNTTLARQFVAACLCAIRRARVTL